MSGPLGTGPRDDSIQWGDPKAMRVLNRDQTRVDGPLKVQGAARYSHDVRLPGLVYARFVTCPYPAAQIKVDPSSAMAVDGVVHAMGVLGRRSDENEGETSFLGQPVAVVVGTTPERAEDGIAALGVEYTELPWVVTRDRALEEGAPAVSRNGNVRAGREVGTREDAEAAIEASDAQAGGTYSCPIQHHVCLETHGVVADYRGEEAVVYASSQAVSDVPGSAARFFELEANKVRAITDHMGGGFGSKFGLGVEGATACKLSKLLGRPVHLMLTREQESLMAGNRSGTVQTIRGGANRDGRLQGVVAEIDKLGGVQRGSHPGIPYIYQVPSESSYALDRSVYTHTDGSRAMRAPGHPQASFGMESLVDELAYGVGVDPLEFRKRNLPGEVYPRQLDRVAREIGWYEHPNKTDFDRSEAWVKEGIGFGVATWGSGGRQGCGVEVRIDRGGSVQVSVGVQDLGTGVRTAVAAIVAEELGLDLDQVEGRVGRSDYPRGVGSGGSVTSPSVAPPTKEAAHKARLELLARVAEAREVDAATLRVIPGGVAKLDSDEPILDWKQACAVLGPDGLVASSMRFRSGEWDDISHLASRGVHGAQAARVSVDMLTGAVKVLHMAAIQDVGLPMNRLALRSQIQGAMIQALSYALLEERVLDPDWGWNLNANLEDYKIAGCLEIPRFTTLIDEEDVGRGVIGVGEPPIIPGHSAIANAIYNACGVRLREMPFTPDKILMGLAALDSEGGPR